MILSKAYRAFDDRINPVLLRHFGVAAARQIQFLSGQRLRLFRSFEIGCVVDVGANEGQYGVGLRRMGYRGEIHSFEPGGEAFEGLSRRAKEDPKWHVYNSALGESESMVEMFTWPGGDSDCSSLREPSAELLHLLGEPHVEKVSMTSLDKWIGRVAINDLSRCWLKLDTQGSEQDVLIGAREVLEGIAGVEIEMPLRRWYEGSADLMTLMKTLTDSGLTPASIMTERFRSEWQGAIDVDALFVRRRAE